MVVQCLEGEENPVEQLLSTTPSPAEQVTPTPVSPLTPVTPVSPVSPVSPVAPSSPAEQVLFHCHWQSTNIMSTTAFPAERFSSLSFPK